VANLRGARLRLCAALALGALLHAFVETGTGLAAPLAIGLLFYLRAKDAKPSQAL
jgi:hypothetical protein